MTVSPPALVPAAAVRGTTAAPLLNGGTAPSGAAEEILVVLRGPADLTGSLPQAAARARAEHRPLAVVVVAPPRTWTVDAAVVAVQERRRHREIESMASAARRTCTLMQVDAPEVIVLQPSWSWTRRHRERIIDRLLGTLAVHRGAELHPAAGTAAPGDDVALAGVGAR
jgi:hypothetical protein